MRNRASLFVLVSLTLAPVAIGGLQACTVTTLDPPTASDTATSDGGRTLDATKVLAWTPCLGGDAASG